jgi:hypothetical protein
MLAQKSNITQLSGEVNAWPFSFRQIFPKDRNDLAVNLDFGDGIFGLAARLGRYAR